MITPIAIAFAAGTALTAGWLRLVSTVTGTRRIPICDLLLITGLCSALAPLPRAGWILAVLIMSLLVTKAEQIDAWPEAVLMVGSSAFLWLVTAIAVTSVVS